MTRSILFVDDNMVNMSVQNMMVHAAEYALRMEEHYHEYPEKCRARLILSDRELMETLENQELLRNAIKILEEQSVEKMKQRHGAPESTYHELMLYVLFYRERGEPVGEYLNGIFELNVDFPDYTL